MEGSRGRKMSCMSSALASTKASAQSMPVAFYCCNQKKNTRIAIRETLGETNRLLCSGVTPHSATLPESWAPGSVLGGVHFLEVKSLGRDLNFGCGLFSSKRVPSSCPAVPGIVLVAS